MSVQAIQPKSYQSPWFVIAITIIALILGAGLRNSVEGTTRTHIAHGVQAEIPGQWLASDASGGAGFLQLGDKDPNLAFSTWDSLHPETRYSVSKLPFSASATLPEMAAVRNLQRGQSLNLYRVLEQTPVELEGRAGYKIAFAYVNPGSMGDVPAVIRGIDYYFASNNQVLVVTLETTESEYPGAIEMFQDFATSVTVGG